MTDFYLTQSDADQLIAVEKHREDKEVYDFPSNGESLSIPLKSADKREDFMIDIYRGKINLLKTTNQTRARKVVPLVRLDFGGSPHQNPDGTEVPCPHIHIYREGYADKWAFPLPEDIFSGTSDRIQMLNEFMSYCNVTKKPNIQGAIW